MRKLILFILSLLLLTSVAQRAYALRVGDIEVYSALNQPLEAEITIVPDRPGESEGMIVALASESVFEQQGVNWVYHLTKLKFQLATKPDGTQIIKVSTHNPVREPFLDFLVDIDWPTGRLVRKFTILLDPPVFATKANTQSQSTTQSSSDDSGFFFDDSAITAKDVPDSTVGEPSLIQRDDQAKSYSDSDSSAFADDSFATSEPLSDAVVDFGDVGASDESTISSDDDFILDDSSSDDLAVSNVTDAQSVVDQSDVDVSLKSEENDVFTFDSEDAFVEDVSGTDSLVEDDAYTDSSDEVMDANLSANLSSEDVFEEESFAQRSFGNLTSRKGAIPDISVSLDESIPYDVETTQRLLAEFASEDGGRVATTATSGGDYEVQAGDYLWNIASSHAPAGVSVNQAMLAILRANPDAFLRENINNIKKGAVLRVPDRQEMLEVSEAQARIDVKQQNGLWREYKNQLVGTTSTSDTADQDDAGTSSTFSSNDDSSTTLSIVAPGVNDDSSHRISGQQDGTSDGTTASTNLLLAQEALEAERLEKIELQDRLKDLEGQVSMMQRLITLKDQQYAELQSQLGKGTAATSSTTLTKDSDLPAVETDADETTLDESDQTSIASIDGDEIALDESDQTSIANIDGDVEEPLTDPLQEKVDDLVALDTEDSATDTSGGEQVDDGGVVVEVESDDLLLEDSTSDEVEVLPEPAKEKTYLSFLYELLPKPYSTMVEDFLSEPYGLALLVAIPLIIIVGVVFILRKLSQPRSTKEKSIFLHEPPQDEFEEDIPDMPDEAIKEPALKAEVPAASDFNPERTQTINEAVHEAAVESQAPAPATVDEDEPMDDTTAEADVYLAYGLFDQAEDLLKQALANNPDQHEYRGKLLETYFAEGKKQEFEALARELKSALGGNPGRLWDKAVAMGKEIAPDSNLFSGTADSGLKASDFAPAKPEAADIDLGGETTTTTDVDLALGSADHETDFDLGIDEFVEPGAMADTIISPADTVSADDEAAAISDIDTELEFDLSDDADSEIDDLDADLDLDFNADDLGLGDGETDEGEIETILEAPAEEEPEPEAVVAAHSSEETVALDMDMNLDELDLGGLGDTDETDFDLDDFADAMGDGDAESSAADELLAEIEAADLDLTISSENSEAGEDTIIEDEDESDETIITADIDFDETFTGDSDDDISMDEVNTKLDLARAYIDMGDNDGASSTLNEVVAEGSDQQRKEAKALLSQIG